MQSGGDYDASCGWLGPLWAFILQLQQLQDQVQIGWSGDAACGWLNPLWVLGPKPSGCCRHRGQSSLSTSKPFPIRLMESLGPGSGLASGFLCGQGMFLSCP